MKRQLTAFWKDLNLDAEYIGNFDRIALVRDKKYQERETQLVNRITKEKLRFFTKDKKAAAKN